MPHYTMPDGEKLFVREIGQGENLSLYCQV